MANVTIAGDAAVIKSSMKFEELKTIAKYRAKALTLMGGEDGKEEIFRVDVGCPGESGNINKYGAVFNGESLDGQGYATLTMSILGRPTDKDVKDYIADALGEALINLNALEAKLPAVLGEIAAQKEQVLANVSVIA